MSAVGGMCLGKSDQTGSDPTAFRVGPHDHQSRVPVGELVAGFLSFLSLLRREPENFETVRCRRRIRSVTFCLASLMRYLKILLLKHETELPLIRLSRTPPRY